MICYHGIDLEGRKINSRFLKRDDFEKQLAWMKENCTVLPAEDYFAEKGDTEKLNICLSFDDGYANNFHYVLPLLEKYELPATFYVTASPTVGQNILWNDLLDLLRFNQSDILTQWAQENAIKGGIKEVHSAILSAGSPMIQTFVNELKSEANFMSDQRWDDYWKLMDGKQILAASQHPLITIGSHTCTHPDLTSMNLGDAVNECMQAKTNLEAIIGAEIQDFAFPYGRYNVELVSELVAMGHTRLACLDMINPKASGMLACRERMGNNSHISPKVQMMEFIRGSYF